MLAEVALALGVLDADAGGRPSPAGSAGSRPRPWWCRGSSSRRCRGSRARGRGSRLLARRVVAVAEQDELQLRADVRRPARARPAGPAGGAGSGGARRRPGARPATRGRRRRARSARARARGAAWPCPAGRRSRRTRCPTTPSRSPARGSCRRRRSAGSSSPRLRASRSRRRRTARAGALPISRPCMSVITSSTVSIGAALDLGCAARRVSRRSPLRSWIGHSYTPGGMDRNRPLIGISAYEVPAAFSHWRDMSSVMIPSGYTRSVDAAGGMPLVLPPLRGQRRAARRCSTALVFSGGSDIDPDAYGAAARTRRRRRRLAAPRRRRARADARGARPATAGARHLPRHAAAERRPRRHAAAASRRRAR